MKLFVILITLLFTAIKSSPTDSVKSEATESASLSSCKAREEAIKTQMISLTKLVNTTENQFDALALRTTDYYEKNVLSVGKTLADYEALITEIETNKDTIQAAQSEAQFDLDNFSCLSDDPKLLVSRFRVNMLLIKRGLASYRAAIGNLINAVKNIQ